MMRLVVCSDFGRQLRLARRGGAEILCLPGGPAGQPHAAFGRLEPAFEIVADRLLRPCLERAAAAVASGDGNMIASPLKDSYHTIWFELHEELIHLAGRNRATEEARSGG